MLRPLNDNIQVEIGESSPFAGDTEQKGVETGIVVSLPKNLWYVGFHSFAFEKSYGARLDNKDFLNEVFKDLIGKRVYWTAYTERGSVLKDGDKTYAFLKLTDLIAVENDKKAKPAKSVAVSEAGSVSLN